MALTGSLSDLGIADLVQFPVIAKKTGELIVAGLEDEARLYYNQGVIEHISCGDCSGFDAMVHLISWKEGEFEFRQGVTTEQRTIDVPVDELLEKANAQREMLKARMTAPDSGMQTVPLINGGSVAIQKAMAAAAEKLEYVEHAALYQRDGSLVCTWDQEEFDGIIHDLIGEVIDIFNIHPRAGLQKVYLTDTIGTSIATLVTDELILLLTANDLSSLGMVSVASSKITQAILALAR